MKLPPDCKEFLELLRSHGVEFVLVGAYTLAFHGHPRYTGDLDVFVRASEENATRLEQVIKSFGFAATGLTRADFLQPDQIIQLGLAPARIDILTGISGVTFEEAWAAKLDAELDGLSVSILSKELLIRNKLSVGRKQDLLDVENLTRGDHQER